MPSTEFAEIAQARNGVVTPVFFDRQVVRAEDLTLDRTSRDAELARLRRYLHGWGVVAGLVPFLDGAKLAVSAGYGVTPSGREVFLDQPIVVEGVFGKRVRGCCGPAEPGCELVAEPPEGAGGPVVVTAWLVARPSARPSDLRAGVPANCEHPAAALLPARSCGGISLGLLCALPPLHEPPGGDCAAVLRLLRGVDGGPPDPVDLPPAVLPEDDLLVLARVVVDGDDQVGIDLGTRRRLLPMWVLQEWIVRCAPQLDGGPPEGPAPDRRRPAWTAFRQHLRDLGFAGHAELVRGRPRLPEILDAPAVLAALEQGGVPGPREFLDTDPDRLAALTGLAEDAVLRARDRLAALAPFFGSGTT